MVSRIHEEVLPNEQLWQQEEEGSDKSKPDLSPRPPSTTSGASDGTFNRWKEGATTTSTPKGSNSTYRRTKSAEVEISLNDDLFNTETRRSCGNPRSHGTTDNQCCQGRYNYCLE